MSLKVGRGYDWNYGWPGPLGICILTRILETFPNWAGTVHHTSSLFLWYADLGQFGKTGTPLAMHRPECEAKDEA